jgi:hypothetical protein
MAFGGLQVELHHAFVAVQVLEIRPVAVAAEFFSAGIGRFDADDVGAPIGQVTNCCRPGPREGQIEDDNARERQLGGAALILPSPASGRGAWIG